MAINVSIRPCRQDECPAIFELWQAAGSIPSVTDSLRALELVLRHDADLLLVAETNGQIIGTIMGGWDGWRANIYRLAVLPQFRRQGIGRALVGELEFHFRQKGAQKISILVEGNDELAKVFWNALGDTGYQCDPRIIRYTKTL
ncbi:MAG TPA: GNAT family N-acetyltransferase [Dehalococcoidia bacterium]|nr:GNAT family N-acetyltransferase [Dehalococcoidia bacterium]